MFYAKQILDISNAKAKADLAIKLRKRDIGEPFCHLYEVCVYLPGVEILC